jgi:flagellar M-ring protein FliF
MFEFLKKTFNQMKEIFNKLDTTKKIIVGVVTGVIVIAFIVLFSVSSTQPNVVLFSDLNTEDFGQVTKKLEDLGYSYQTSGQTTILVRPNQRDLILTKLAQEKMIPKGIPGWKLFDMTKWTETEKELDVKYMRALRDEITRHIESLRNIEKADVDIAMIEDSIYTDNKTPFTAAVTVQLKPGYDKLSKKEIKGIIYLVSRAVGNRLKPENITVTDEYGTIISDFDDELDKAKTEYTILEYRHRLNMEFNWDKVAEEQEEYSPIVLEKADPTKPYSTRKIKDSLVISEKTTQEKFQGHGWNPEGPAGTEGNVPPGYKASDDQYAKYSKNEEIKNHAVNKTMRKIERAPYEISKVSVAVAIDGIQSLPKLPNGEYDLDPAKQPVQTPLTPEQLKKAENIVKKAINYNDARGDQVAVENIMFDRSKYWDILRGEFKRKEQIKRILLAALIGVIALFVGFILFRAVSKELERRRRAREEQLALEQQRMREAALRAAEEEGIDVELSLEERARLELQENAVNLAKERPDDVAQLLRTWLAEE